MKKGMTIYTDTGDIAAVFYSLERRGSNLVIDAKSLGVMRMDMIFPSREVFNGLRMAVSWGLISFVLLLPYFGLKHIAFRLFKRRKGEESAHNQGEW